MLGGLVVVTKGPDIGSLVVAAQAGMDAVVGLVSSIEFAGPSKDLVEAWPNCRGTHVG